MKLQLSDHKGIQILMVTGPVNTHDFAVLSAGISKFLRSGKNRMILELVSATTLDDRHIRELGNLNQLARELSGEIVLVAQDAQLRQKIEHFGRPNAIQCRENKGQGYEVFLVKGGAIHEPEIASPKTLLERDEEIKKLRDLLKQKEGGESHSLKEENARLKDEKAKLEQQLQLMVIHRRLPPDEPAHQEKVRILELEIDGLLAKVASLEAQRVKSP